MATESKCPVMHGPGRHKMTGTTANQHWWPNQLTLKVLHQNPPQLNPLGARFDYAEARISHLTAAQSSTDL